MAKKSNSLMDIVRKGQAGKFQTVVEMVLDSKTVKAITEEKKITAKKLYSDITEESYTDANIDHFKKEKETLSHQIDRLETEAKNASDPKARIRIQGEITKLHAKYSDISKKHKEYNDKIHSEHPLTSPLIKQKEALERQITMARSKGADVKALMAKKSELVKKIHADRSVYDEGYEWKHPLQEKVAAADKKKLDQLKVQLDDLNLKHEQLVQRGAKIGLNDPLMAQIKAKKLAIQQLTKANKLKSATATV